MYGYLMGKCLFKFLLRFLMAAPVLLTIPAFIIYRYLSNIKNKCSLNNFIFNNLSQTLIWIILSVIFSILFAIIGFKIILYLIRKKQKHNSYSITVSQIENISVFIDMYTLVSIAYTYVGNNNLGIVEYISLPLVITLLILFKADSISCNFIFIFSGYKLYKIVDIEGVSSFIVSKSILNIKKEEIIEVIKIDNYIYIV